MWFTLIVDAEVWNGCLQYKYSMIGPLHVGELTKCHKAGVSYTSTVNLSTFADACSAGHWCMIAHNSAAALTACNPVNSSGLRKRVIH